LESQKPKTEPKCWLFAWTSLHKRIITANNLSKRGWRNDAICKLCRSNPETPTHPCKDCPFTKEACSFIKQWFGFSILNTVNMTGSLHKFWHKYRIKFDKNQRRYFDGNMAL
jgi:hypothetical protein